MGSRKRNPVTYKRKRHYVSGKREPKGITPMPIYDITVRIEKKKSYLVEAPTLADAQEQAIVRACEEFPGKDHDLWLCLDDEPNQIPPPLMESL